MSMWSWCMSEFKEFACCLTGNFDSFCIFLKGKIGRFILNGISIICKDQLEELS